MKLQRFRDSRAFQSTQLANLELISRRSLCNLSEPIIKIRVSSNSASQAFSGYLRQRIELIT